MRGLGRRGLTLPLGLLLAGLHDGRPVGAQQAAGGGGGGLRGGDDPATETGRECADGLDNDGDGRFDCADLDCREAAGRAWAHCPRAPGACVGCPDTCVEGVCLDLGIPPGCRWWNDGCNTCEVFEGRLRGCTMQQCATPAGRSFCSGFTDGTVCSSPDKCGADLGQGGTASESLTGATSGACAVQVAAIANFRPGNPPPPQCDDLGDYLPVQCWAQSGECWCVDTMGVEIAGTRRMVVGAQVLDVATCAAIAHAGGSGHR